MSNIRVTRPGARSRGASSTTPALRAFDPSLLAEIHTSISGAVNHPTAAAPIPTATAPVEPPVTSTLPRHASKSAITISSDVGTEKAALERARVAAIEEREMQSSAHKRRMAELDTLRKLLESRASEVEAAHKNVDKEKRKLHAEYEAKIAELSEAKSRLERQVAKMEQKESQLKTEWSKFEEEKAKSLAEAEAHLYALAQTLAAGAGVQLNVDAVVPLERGLEDGLTQWMETPTKDTTRSPAVASVLQEPDTQVQARRKASGSMVEKRNAALVAAATTITGREQALKQKEETLSRREAEIEALVDTIEELQRREASLRQTVQQLQKVVDGSAEEDARGLVVPLTQLVHTWENNLRTPSYRQTGAAAMPIQEGSPLSSARGRGLRSSRSFAVRSAGVSPVSTLLTTDSVSSALNALLPTPAPMDVATPKERLPTSPSRMQSSQSPMTSSEALTRRVKVTLREQSLERKEAELTKKEAQLAKQLLAFKEWQKHEEEILGSIKEIALQDVNAQRAALTAMSDELAKRREELDTRQQLLEQELVATQVEREQMRVKDSALESEKKVLELTRKAFRVEAEEQRAQLLARELAASDAAVQVQHEREEFDRLRTELRAKDERERSTALLDIAEAKARVAAEQAAWENELEAQRKALQKEREELVQGQADLLTRVEQVAAMKTQADTDIKVACDEARRIAQTRAQLETHVAEADRRLEEVSRLEEECAARNQALAEREEEQDRVRAELESMHEELQRGLSTVEKELRDARSFKAEMEQRAASTVANAEHAEKINSELAERLLAINRRDADADAALQKVRADREELQQLQELLEQRSKQLTKQENELSGRESDQISLQRQLEKTSARLERDRVALENRIRESQAAAEAQRADLDRQAAQLREDSERLSSVLAEAGEKTEAQEMMLRNQEAELRRTATSLQTDLDNYVNKYNLLAREFEALREISDKAEADLNATRLQHSQTKQLLAQAEQSNIAAQRETNRLLAVVTNLEKTRDDDRESISSLKRQLKEKGDEYTARLQEMRTAQIDSQRQYEAAVAENKQLQANLDQTRKDIEQEVVLMNEKLASYEQQIEATIAQSTAAVQLNDKLTADLKSQQATCEQLRNQLSASQEKSRLDAAAISALTDEKASLLSTADTATRACAHLEQRIQLLNAEHDKLIASSSSVAVVEELERKLHVCQSEVSKLTEDLNQATLTANSRQNESDDFRKQLTEARLVNEHLVEENASLSGKLQADQKLFFVKQNEFSATIATLKAAHLVEVQKLKEQIKLQQQAQPSPSKRASLDAEIETLRGQITTVKAAHKVEIERFLSENAKLVATIDEHKDAWQTLQQSKLKLLAQHSAEVEKMLASRTELQTALEAAEVRLRDVSSELAVEKQTVGHLREEAMSLQKEISTLRNLQAAGASVVEQHAASLGLLNERVAALQQELMIKDGQLTEARKSQERLQQLELQFHELQVQSEKLISDYQMQLSQCQETVLSLQGSVATLENRSDHLSRNLAEAEEALSALRQTALQHEADCATTQAELRIATQEADQLRRERDEVLLRAESSEAYLDNVRVEKQHLETQVAVMLEAAAKNAAEQASEQQSAREAHLQLQDELKRASDERDNLAVVLKSKQEELAAVRQLLEGHEVELTALQGKCAVLEAEVAEYSRQLQESREATSAEFADLAARKGSELRKALADIATEKAAYQALQGTIQEIHLKVQAVAVRRLCCTTSMARAIGRPDHVLTKRSAFERWLRVAFSEGRTAAQGLQAHAENVERLLQDKEGKLAAVQAQVTALQDALVDSALDVQRLTAEVEEVKQELATHMALASVVGTVPPIGGANPFESPLPTTHHPTNSGYDTFDLPNPNPFESPEQITFSGDSHNPFSSPDGTVYDATVGQAPNPFTSPVHPAHPPQPAGDIFGSPVAFTSEVVQKIIQGSTTALTGTTNGGAKPDESAPTETTGTDFIECSVCHRTFPMDQIGRHSIACYESTKMISSMDSDLSPMRTTSKPAGLGGFLMRGLSKPTLQAANSANQIPQPLLSPGVQVRSLNRGGSAGIDSSPVSVSAAEAEILAAKARAEEMRKQRERAESEHKAR